MASNFGVNARGSAIYKKKEGTLSISKDQKSIIWTPSQPRDATPGLLIDVINITNLQQTPETAPKVMLKIFEKPVTAPEPVTHVLTFNSPTNPREEAKAIKEILSNLIAAVKASDSSNLKLNGSLPANETPSGLPPALPSDQWYEDAHLKNDIELQQSLMKNDPSLQRTYMESRRTKPETITDSQFNAHFWSTRTNVLRAHAVEVNQKRGPYNVLSAVKIKGEKMNIKPEHIQLIFSQHPLVKQIYDENVPKLNEVQFWERFFLSRLYKKLKGQRITEADATDPTFDRYLDRSDEKRQDDTQVPHFIDLEGNEENQGGMRSGNKKDFTMIPGSAAKVPIIRSLNNVSERIMANVAPSDIDPANPIGMDEETFNSLALRDLQVASIENRIELNIKQQGQFFANDKSLISEEAKLYSVQVASEVLQEMESDLVMDGTAEEGLDLHSAIGVLEESDSEDENKISHVGSKSSFVDAHKHMMEGISARRKEIDGTASKSSLAGLSDTVFQKLTLTHATTTEFLNHFWLIFLSGDAERAGDLAKMVESLDRAMGRINAVAADAEKERQETIARHRQHIKDVYNRTQKKIQWNPSSVGGGEKVVKEMMEPIVKTLLKALADYKKAFVAESAEAL